MYLKRYRKFVLSTDLKVFGAKSVSTGDLLFFNYVITFLNYLQMIAPSSYIITSHFCIYFTNSGSMGEFLL